MEIATEAAETAAQLGAIAEGVEVATEAIETAAQLGVAAGAASQLEAAQLAMRAITEGVGVAPEAAKKRL